MVVAVETLTHTLCDQLLDVWESAVRATHTFLSEQDIVVLRPDVRAGLCAVEQLHACYDGSEVVGFIGLHGQKIEMLFVRAGVHGHGFGRQLLTHAVDVNGACEVDVNEQNERGLGFYLHMGFEVVGRSPYDDQGRPFPLLHMRLT